MEEVEKIIGHWARLFRGIEKSLRPLANALTDIAETFNEITGFRATVLRREILANSIQAKFKVHPDTAEWMAWRLPDCCLPSEGEVKAIVALEDL